MLCVHIDIQIVMQDNRKGKCEVIIIEIRDSSRSEKETHHYEKESCLVRKQVKQTTSGLLITKRFPSTTQTNSNEHALNPSLPPGCIMYVRTK